MPIPNENIMFLIDKALPLLKESGISYWLGRGVLGDFLENGELKCAHSDVDFHVWGKDQEILKKIMNPVFDNDKFKKIDEKHKLAFEKTSNGTVFLLEFMYLFDDENVGYVYHISCNKKCVCPKYCFPKNGGKTKKIGNRNIPIPSNIEEYFSQVYKNNQWREKYKN